MAREPDPIQKFARMPMRATDGVAPDRIVVDGLDDWHMIERLSHTFANLS
jgi:hypothetical protein